MAPGYRCLKSKRRIAPIGFSSSGEVVGNGTAAPLTTSCGLSGAQAHIHLRTCQQHGQGELLPPQRKVP